jgi:hypothetical protein
MPGGILLRRAWTYWVVKGLIPLETATGLFADPVGKTDIRVSGHCGCPAPEDPWLLYLDDEGRTVVKASEKKEFEKFGLTIPSYYRFEPEPKLFKPFVHSYHIDSEVGLRIFADAIRTFSFHQMVTLDKFAKVSVHHDEKPEPVKA